MRQATIQLAGREYTVTQLPIRANREWRKRFDEPLDLILGALKDLQPLVGQEWETTDSMVKAIGERVIGRLGGLGEVMLGMSDTILESLFAYSPEMANDREWIEEKAFDDEAMKAFLEVVKLAFPFGGLLKALA